MGLSPLMPPCYQQGGLGTAWLQSLLPGRSMSSSTLGLPNAFRAQQLPDPGSDCPTGGPGEACVTLSNVALPRQPPSLLACPSPASPLPPLEVQEIRARETDPGAVVNHVLPRGILQCSRGVLGPGGVSTDGFCPLESLWPEGSQNSLPQV